MVCRLLKKCRGWISGRRSQVASAVDSGRYPGCERVTGRRMRGGWLAIGEDAGGAQGVSNGLFGGRRHRGVVRTLAREAAGAVMVINLSATMLAVRWASVARGLSG